MLDRLLATLGRDDDRVGLWIAEATRAPDGARGARAYVRAAANAEDTLGHTDDALKMLRSAWATRPGDEDALDAQLRILARSTNEEERGRRAAAVDLLVRAADLAQDIALRVAHLEKAATIAEEFDAARAAELYTRVLALSPTRRFAIVALQRALHRAGDHAALATLLEREAEQTTDVEHAATLRLRAAEVFHRDANNIERAVALLRRILDVRADHEGALLALLSCHEQTGRLDDAREVLRTLVPLRRVETVPLELAIAELSRRLGDSDATIAALRAVLAVAAEHPIAQRDLARALRRKCSWAEAAEATLAVDPVLAGELFEWRVGDDQRAAAAYRVRANDPVAYEGLCRVAEKNRDAEALEQLYGRDEWRLADLVLRSGGDPARAATLLGLIADDVDRARTLYEACVRANDESGMADALATIADKSSDPRAKRRAHLQRFRSKGAASDVRATHQLFPDDLHAVALLTEVAEGEERVAALETLVANEEDPSCKFLLHLRLATTLDDKRALPHALSALELDDASPAAIATTIRAATKLRDRAAQLRGERAAAAIARDPAERIRHLLTGASLAREVDGQEGVATELIDGALAADPESIEAATAATQHLIGRDPATLLSLFYRAAFAAQRPERIVALAREASSLADALGEHDRAAALLGRARSFDPRNVAVLVDLGDVLRHQGAWAEAGRAYDDAIGSGTESGHRELLARAHRAIAELAEGPFADPLRAIVALRAVIRLEPNDLDAQRRLAGVLGRQGQPMEADAILTAIAGDPRVAMHVRLATLDQLSELRLANKDRTGAEQALRERVKLDPALRGESWTKLAEFHKEHLRGDESLADTLNELVVDSGADPNWLLELAEIELRLGRERAAILHLRMASKMVKDDVRPLVALAGALLAIAENDEAAKVLSQLLQRDPTNADVLAARERALLGASAREEALVVAELRSWLGQVDESGRFRERRVHPNAPREGVLDDVVLAKHILPRGAPKAVFDVLRVVSRAMPKVTPPQPLATYGISSRERITAKSGHPLRTLGDRLCVALGLEKVDVYIRNATDGAVDIEPHDPPALIVPSYLLALPEMEVVFAVARALARYALGGYAVDKLGARGVATAIAAAVAPLGGTLPVVDGEEIERRLNKALDRTARKSLEPLAREVKPFDPDALIRAVEQGAIRVAYLLSGDLGSALTNVRRRERIHVGEVGREGTSTGDLIRFALADESVALRKQLGITWAQG
jgi:tetratricopeptide (TPR) repeat protein